MTNKQIKFCDEYLIDCNATRAYKAAYPHIKSNDAARANASRLLTNANVKDYIQRRLEEISSEKIADAEEVMKYLTSVMRGQADGEEIVTEFIGDGMSEARRMRKKPSEKDKLKAAELLGKRFGLFKDSINLDSDSELTIHIDYGDDAE